MPSIQTYVDFTRLYIQKARDRDPTEMTAEAYARCAQAQATLAQAHATLVLAEAIEKSNRTR